MFAFEKVQGVKYKYPYWQIADDLNALKEKHTDAASVEAKGILQDLAKDDLFFLLYFMLGLDFLNNPFHVPRVYEAQQNPTDVLHLWAREHGKSTIITKGMSIHEIINDPEVTIGILSYNRALAKSFLRGIKTELELNTLLRDTFDDIFYKNPEREAVKWSEEDGLVVKRKSILPESTVEAWGLVDGQPTGKHFKVRMYDDIVTKDTIGTPEQIEKTKEAFRMSANVGRRFGKKRVVGTIYHHADLYRELEKSGKWKTIKHPAEVDGVPTYLTEEELQSKRSEMGVYVYSSQMLLDPVAEGSKKFQLEWLKYYTNHPKLNTYIVVDPAGSKNRRSDYTVMWVFGVDSMKNKFVLDCVRDRLNLGERWKKLRGLIEKWKPLAVGYEKYGMIGDIDYIKEKMEEEGFYFKFQTLGGAASKIQRIEGLIPYFEGNKIFLPKYLPYRQLDGKVVDIINSFISEEYLTFPYSEHDDMIDCLARMNDDSLNLMYPFSATPKIATRKPYDPFKKSAPESKGWMGQ